jgi:hypothetical protein
MNVRTATRAAAAVAGAGALAALTGGLAHADTPEAGGYDGASSSPSAGSGESGPESGSESGSEEAGESSGTPVFLLDGLPGAPVPEDLLKPVDLTAPVFGALDGLS